MNNRNDATLQEATGVIAPFVRAATHIGWCIGYLGSIDHEELTQEETQAIIDDLEDALKHVNEPETSNLLDAFVGDPGLTALREFREDLTQIVPSQKEELLEILQILADNAAFSGAVMERLMTGNTDAQAGRNL